MSLGVKAGRSSFSRAAAGTVARSNRFTQSAQTPALFQAIMQEHDGLGARDGGFLPGALQDFLERGQLEVMIVRDRIALADGGEILDIDGLQRIDGGTVLAIGENATAVWVAARRHRGGIDFSGAEIDCVVFLEEHASCAS